MENIFIKVIVHEIYFKVYGNVLACIKIYFHIKLYMYAYVKALWKFMKCLKNA